MWVSDKAVTEKQRSRDLFSARGRSTVLDELVPVSQDG